MPAARAPRGRGRGEGAGVAVLPGPTPEHGGTSLGPEAGRVEMMVAVNFRIFQFVPEPEHVGQAPRRHFLPAPRHWGRPALPVSILPLPWPASAPGAQAAMAFCPHHPPSSRNSGSILQPTQLGFARQPHTRACTVPDTVLGVGTKTSPCPPGAHVPPGGQTGARASISVGPAVFTGR